MYPTQAYRLHRKPGVRKRKACETQGVSRTLASEAVWRGSAFHVPTSTPIYSDRAQTCLESSADGDRLRTLRKRYACAESERYASVGRCESRGRLAPQCVFHVPTSTPTYSGRAQTCLESRVDRDCLCTLRKRTACRESQRYASVGGYETQGCLEPLASEAVWGGSAPVTSPSLCQQFDRAQTCPESLADGDRLCTLRKRREMRAPKWCGAAVRV